MFDDVDLSKIDVCLVTHFHVDHSAALPYLIGRTNFKVLHKGMDYLILSITQNIKDFIYKSQD